MHLSPLLTTLAFVTHALATLPSALNKRQSEQIPCPELGMKDCGDVCIRITDTCCPDRTGGCSLGNTCVLGDNGEYGCCPIGEVCVGDGGATTNRQTLTSTETLPPVEEPTSPPPEETEEPVPEEPVPEEPVPEETEEPVPEEPVPEETDEPEPEPEVPEVTEPPVLPPTPIPSGEPEETPIVTDAAAVNGPGITGLLGCLVGVAALLL